MRELPVRARERGEIIGTPLAELKQGNAELTHAILVGWLCLPRPMDDGGLVHVILQVNQKALARIKNQAAHSVWLLKPEHHGRTTVNFKRTLFNQESVRCAFYLPVAVCFRITEGQGWIKIGRAHV